MSTTPVAVIVLAAGAGTRMKSDTPKMLHQIGGRSLLSHSLYTAKGLNPDHLVVVVGHQKELVAQAVEAWQEDTSTTSGVALAHQEQQNGTGHAVMCGMDSDELAGFTGTVVVTNADVPLLSSSTLDSLVNAHTHAPAAAVTVLTVEAPTPTGYGRIIRNADGEVTAIVEEKDATEDQRRIKEVNTGVFAFDADVLRNSLVKVDTNNAQGEMYLTDVLGIARNEGLIARGHMAHDPAELAGVNDRVQLAAAGRVLNRHVCEKHMRNGATIIDPESTWIDVDVTIGRDVTIHPGTQLHGTTRIEDNAEIGPDTTLTNVTVGSGTQVIRSHGSHSTIGSNAHVGPFSYLRHGTHLNNEGKIGTYVETKNATIGRGTKVPHLTYVGDATIGEYSNIGCSSVFANYDGVNKHHTTVGSHVRTGSDTTFVAPVTVGDGAYSGAGTVITDDVPAGALVVPGTRQRVIEGWVAKKRPGTAAARAAEVAGDAQGTGFDNEHAGDERISTPESTGKVRNDSAPSDNSPTDRT